MNILILHKFGGSPSDAWYSAVKQEMQAQGHRVVIPQLPNPNEPKLAAWLKTALQSYRDHQPEIVIGHSLGGSLVFRLLEQVGGEGVVKKAIVVAPPVYAKPEDNLHRTEFFNQPLNWGNLKSFPIQYTIFYSSDDQSVSQEHAELVRDKLEAEYKLFFNRGHFLQTEFPELIQAILG